MTKVKATFTTAIDLIGKDKVAGLLEKFGYNEEPTAELVMEVIDKEGAAFTVPFGKLMQKAGKSAEAQAKFLAAARKSKASGKTSTLTDEQKAENALSYFNSIASLLGTGLGSVSDIVNASNGTNQYTALAQYYAEQRKAEEASQKTTLYWILGGVAVLLIVVVFLVALTKRN